MGFVSVIYWTVIPGNSLTSGKNTVWLAFEWGERRQIIKTCAPHPTPPTSFLFPEGAPVDDQRDIGALGGHGTAQQRLNFTGLVNKFQRYHLLLGLLIQQSPNPGLQIQVHLDGKVHICAGLAFSASPNHHFPLGHRTAFLSSLNKH